MSWISAGASAVSGLFDLYGSSREAAAFAGARDDIQNMPGMHASGLSGNFGQVDANGNFAINQGLGANQNALAQQSMGLLGGGLFNQNNFQQAFQNNDISSALNQANQAFGQQTNAQNFGGLTQRNQQLGGLLQGLVGSGPQDQSGGLQNSLFAQGNANQMAAGNQQALFNQSLAAQRAAFAPQANQQFNRLQDRLFAQGRLGSTGGAENLRGLFEAQNQADLGFQNNAFNQAQQQQQFLGQLGGQQIGQAQGLLGQNNQQFNSLAGLLQNNQQLGGNILNQQFGQQLQANQQNQSAGLNRLQAAQGLFGQGNDIFASQYGLGLGGQEALLGYGNFGLTAASQPFQNQAGLLSGSSGHSSALANMAAGAGQAQNGFFSGIGSVLGSIF